MRHWTWLQQELEERRSRRARHHAWLYLGILVALLIAFWPLPAHGQAPRIPDAERYYPDYRAAYADAVDCTKIAHPRPYEALIWMKVPRVNFTDPLDEGDEAKLPNIGEFVRPDTIYIATSWEKSWVPKHEMIHYLTDIMKNDRKIFGDACHAMWGYLPTDTTSTGHGVTIKGPAYKDE